MGIEDLALWQTNDFPIRHQGNVHSGKVRSIYWLDEKDSRRLAAEEHGISPDTQLGIMITSDRISAFDCNWRGENGLDGIPGKGAALNAISKHWFNQFDKAGLAGNHVLGSPHPLVWIVQRAEPILVEAIARKYLAGSMWRAYEKGVREFSSIRLHDGLKRNDPLPELLITPTTKGILRGIPGVPESDDTNITREQIERNYERFGFKRPEDVELYERLLKSGFELISEGLISVGEVFADTKFELGYVKNGSRMIYIDEVGTPDSSRMWDLRAYARGRVVENSKESFRQLLLRTLDGGILLDSTRMPERKKLAETYRIPVEQMMEISGIYRSMAEKITGASVPAVRNARESILDSLLGYGLVV